MIKVDEKDPEVRTLRAEESKLQTLLSDRAAEEAELARTIQIYLSRRKSNERARLEAEADELLRGTAMKANPDDDLKDIEVIEHRISVLDIAIDKRVWSSTRPAVASRSKCVRRIVRAMSRLKNVLLKRWRSWVRPMKAKCFFSVSFRMLAATQSHFGQCALV
jgi:hypothetical protein